MASHNLRGSHDEIQIEIQSLHSLGCANDQQIPASLAIRTFITKDLDAARHQARPHSCNAAGAFEVALDIEQLLYEATTLLNAASLINRIARQS